MHVKNKPEPQAAKPLMHSLELSLRPIQHPELPKRVVQRHLRVHAIDDVRLLSLTHATLCNMLGYQQIGYTAYASLAAEVINQMPEEYRRLAASMIITGDAMDISSEGNTKTLARVPRYPVLAEKSAHDAPALWTPGS